MYYRLKTKQELGDYCIRKLGGGVYNVEITPEQLSDRIDEALQQFLEFHTDSVEQIYYLIVPDAETCDRGYVELPPTVLAVTDIVSTPFQNTAPYEIYFDSPEYQYFANWRMTNVIHEIHDYRIIKQHFELLNQTFDVYHRWRFSKLNGRLIPHDASMVLQLGIPLIVSASKVIDLDTATYIYNDEWLKRFTTALLKEQWGTNISKFEGVQGVGGVTLNGDRILQEGINEVEKLRDEYKLKYEEPPMFMMG